MPPRCARSEGARSVRWSQRAIAFSRLSRATPHTHALPLAARLDAVRATTGGLDVPMILAAYAPARWADIKDAVRLPLEDAARRRLVDIAMDELPAVLPLYDRDAFCEGIAPGSEEYCQERASDHVYHERLPLVGPDTYCPFAASARASPAELALWSLCRATDGGDCCDACARFGRADVRAGSDGAARDALAPLIDLAWESSPLYTELTADARGVFADAPGPWRDLPALMRLMGRDTRNPYLDLDPDSWDEATERVRWTLAEVRFFAHAYARARAYYDRVGPVRAALAAPDGAAMLTWLLTTAVSGSPAPDRAR